MLHRCERVEKDDKEAVKWLHKAAEQGLAEAQYALGRVYVLGQGVEKVFSEAEKWYFKAAVQDYEPAKTILEKISALNPPDENP